MPLSLRLRAETRLAHLDAETQFDLDNRLHSRATYARLLTALRSFYTPLEDACAGIRGWNSLTPAVDILARNRTGLLAHDLFRLNVSLLNMGLPESDPFVPVTLAQGLGCLYVMEGSALGGRVISRLARDALGPDLPVRFFTADDRPCLGGDWRALQRALDYFGANSNDTSGDEVIAAALHTFGTFAAILHHERLRRDRTSAS